MSKGFHMINVSTQLPAVWSPPAGQAVSAVPAVAAIRPVQESGRNGQPGSGTDPEAASARPGRRRAEPDSAPILPRPSPENEDGRLVGARTSSAQPDLSAQAEAEQRTEQEAAQRAADEARRQQMQAVLTNVWKASAAVVDRVLGRDEAGIAATPNPADDTARASLPARFSEQLELPWPAQAQAAATGPVRLADDREPVAYDARGHSSLAPMEPGVLISRRV
jgi:hypothetical protein